MKVKKTILYGGDFCLALLAMYAGFVVRFGYLNAKAEIVSKPFVRSIIFAFVLIVSSYLFDVYSFEKHRRKRETLMDILIAASISFVLLSTVFFVNPDLTIGRGLLVISLCAFIVFQYVWHIVFTMGIGHPSLAERIAILGTGVLAKQIGDLVIRSEHQFNHTLVGYVAGGNKSESDCIPQEEIIGTASDLIGIADREKITKIIVSLPERGGVYSARNVLLNCKLHGIEILDTPTFYEQVTGKLMLENMNITWLIYSSGFKRTAFVSAVKRIVDVCLSLTGIVLTAPLFPLIVLLIKLDSSGPIFFSQVRVGQGEENFVLYKFRTMSQNVEGETGATWAQKDDPRIKPIGRLLRKFRVDEIAQLYNVLIGDMSFIGPRPERPEFVEKLDQLIPYYRKRHFIKPGITGWAQVKFHYGASVEDSYEKLRYDLYYIKHLSPLLDTLIFIQTFKVVIFGRGGR